MDGVRNTQQGPAGGRRAGIIYTAVGRGGYFGCKEGPARNWARWGIMHTNDGRRRGARAGVRAGRLENKSTSKVGDARERERERRLC